MPTSDVIISDRYSYHIKINICDRPYISVYW